MKTKKLVQLSLLTAIALSIFIVELQVAYIATRNSIHLSYSGKR